MAELRIAVRADGGGAVGGGHVMRCLALAAALGARGATVRFVVAELSPGLAQRIADAGHEIARIGSGAGLSQHDDAAGTLEAIAGFDPDWTVVDHYDLGRAWELEVAASGTRIMVIDDLGDRPHHCALLLDQNLGRHREDYLHFVPEAAEILAGPVYALLAPEFAARRPAALARRREAARPRRLLISLGMTDQSLVVPELVAGALAADSELAIDLVLPAGAAPARVASDPRVRVHIDTRDMAGLIASADLAIGAAGSSAWERCCLGLPSVLFVLADNQRAVAAALADASAACVVEDAVEATTALTRLVRDPPALTRMSAAAFAIADGLGAQRVAARLAGEKNGAVSLSLRDAGDEDRELAWLWRNDPVTRRFSQQPAPIGWPDHVRWWEEVRADPDRHLLVAEQEGAPVGLLRFDREPADVPVYTVSINLRPDARGGGIGRFALAAGLAEIERREGPVRFAAHIRVDNPASDRIFTALGFAAVGTLGANGFGLYERQAKSGEMD